MDLYKSLALKIAQGREQPAVWVSRLVIIEKLSPEPVVIRDVRLSRGLNIIWAEESESDDAAITITGHSAGKTSFCRLLRYVLGERTFGTKANMALIHSAFPSGYVGAELTIRGRLWAVIRPIGSGRSSYLKENATIEDLAPGKADSAGQEEYADKLGLIALLDDLETGAVVRTKQPIEWGHVLAWCTRDQEARFQNCYDWRSPRSESDWPAFRASKTDALFVMRTLLGLFLPKELKGEERLAELVQTRDQLEKQLIELKREPQYRVNLHGQRLKARLQSAMPQVHDIESRPLHWDQLTPDLDRLTEEAVKQLQDEVSTSVADADGMQRQIDAIGADILRKHDEYRTVAAAFGLDTSALVELEAGITQKSNQLQQIDEYRNRDCPFGGVLIGECSYVTDRQESLKIAHLQDAQAMEQAEAKRRSNREDLEAQQVRRAEAIKGLHGQRQEIRRNREQLLSAVEEKRSQSRALIAELGQVIAWTKCLSEPGAFKELDECHRSLKSTEAEISKLNDDLSHLITRHDENRRLLSSVFSGAVKAILASGTYNGEVTFKDRELAFHIVHGGTMSGEAVETLSVLLADVSCLVFNTVSQKSHLPGFLLHDSPREADLGIRLYRTFIRFVAALQSHFASTDQCPFQYIITTTTAPPEELCGGDFVKVQLNAEKREMLLFGRPLAAAAISRSAEELFS